MNWKRYSWRAITCCVSKGMLVVLAMVAVFGSIILGMKWAHDRDVALRAECAGALDAFVASAYSAYYRARDGSATFYEEPRHSVKSQALWDTYADECDWKVETSEPPPTPKPAWVQALARIAHQWALPVAAGFFALSMAVLLLFSICSNQIAYCQAAVDSGRKPWYWLPRIGNPLPARQAKTEECPTCGHEETRAETEDEYRERMGLPPLERES